MRTFEQLKRNSSAFTNVCNDLQTRNLRRSTLSHAIQMRQLMADTIVKIGALAASFCQHDPDSVCYVLSKNYLTYRRDSNVGPSHSLPCVPQHLQA